MGKKNYESSYEEYDEYSSYRRKRIGVGVLCAVFVVLLIAAVISIFSGNSSLKEKIDKRTASTTNPNGTAYFNEAGVRVINWDLIEVPSWITRDIIPQNPYSRPGEELSDIEGIVVHYTANPGTTAKQNRDYFASLGNTGEERYASSHFVIGIDGEIIQCIPMSEVSYASNDRNRDTISIECCHTDETGEFTEATYKSLVKLTAWLSNTYLIQTDSIIRHYDITGKICPKYFVEHEDAWEDFKMDVVKKR